MIHVERRGDNRLKFQLGGLVVKAGLGGEDHAVIFGMMIEGARHLTEPGERERLRAIGKEAFRGEPQEADIDDRSDPRDGRDGDPAAR
ncbi:conjugal transfer protein TraD [Mesorhizobium sediminum]|nr:conjugal transfer protein TraD [Mesorhizobium sediminum]